MKSSGWEHVTHISNKLTLGDAGSTAKKLKNEIKVQTSATRFADFGGNEALLCDICKLLAHLKHPEMYR